MTTVIGDKLRQILAASERWSAAVAKIPIDAIVAQDPIDLDACGAEEARQIAGWVAGSVDEMPARLARYLQAVRG